MAGTVPWIVPEWPAPSQVKALTTLRQSSACQAPGGTFNLSLSVGDNPEAVLRNRAWLRVEANLPTEPIWLKQVHGITVANLDCLSSGQDSLSFVDSANIEADAAIGFEPEIVCAITTADCLPLLLCDRKGTRIAAIHAGWRGLAQGIVEAAVAKLACDTGTLIAWLGPAIGPNAFEVGWDVRNAFIQPNDEFAFQKRSVGKWMADLYRLARERLKRLGVLEIYGGHFCTFTDTERFFSFRRSKITGRMATLIWITSD